VSGHDAAMVQGYSFRMSAIRQRMILLMVLRAMTTAQLAITSRNGDRERIPYW
jgi:hypothetical protein